MDEKIFELSFEIIGYAGNAKGMAFEAISKAKAGNIEEARVLLKESKDEVSGKPVWTSSLLKPIAITAPSFKYDENLNNWVSLSTAVIPAEMLIEPIIISGDFEQNNYRLCLLCEELADPLVSRELAYFEAINDKDLAKITPGTQAIIEWRMQLLQEVTSKNTDTEEANLNG